MHVDSMPFFFHNHHTHKTKRHLKCMRAKMKKKKKPWLQDDSIVLRHSLPSPLLIHVVDWMAPSSHVYIFEHFAMNTKRLCLGSVCILWEYRLFFERGFAQILRGNFYILRILIFMLRLLSACSSCLWIFYKHFTLVFLNS